jgi:hypothetical protein
MFRWVGFNMQTVLFLTILVFCGMFGWYLIEDTVHAFIANPFDFIIGWIKSAATNGSKG